MTIRTEIRERLEAGFQKYTPYPGRGGKEFADALEALGYEVIPKLGAEPLRISLSGGEALVVVTPPGSRAMVGSCPRIAIGAYPGTGGGVQVYIPASTAPCPE